VANNRRKSAAIALAVLGIAGLSLASASQLTVTGGELQAGTHNFTDCQSGDVTASLAAGAWTAASNTYMTGDVVLTGINNTGCSGKHIEAVLLGAGNVSLATASDTIGAATMTLTPTSVDAQLVKGIAVVISDS
jgi:hypothetical protein